MQKVKAVLLLVFIAAVSVATVLYSGASAAFYIMPGPDVSSVSGNTASSQNAVSSEPTVSVAPTPSHAPETPSAPPSSQAVPTVQEGTVKGKIISKTIAPSTATLSYNNIYVKNNAGISIDLKSELSEPFKLGLGDASAPQVLIYHTHATESFLSESRDYYTDADVSRTTDTAKNMVAVGEQTANALRAAGFSVLHDASLHDYPSYNGSYTASAKTIKSYLAKYPSIKVVIDLHRDAVSSGDDKVKLCREIGGRNAAQVMLVMGSQSGSVTGYPNWKQNFRLAIRLHQKLETLYPGLARPILLVSKKYNQNLSNGGMLIEIGTDANSLDEALYSGALVGNALAEMLKEIK